jgi:hypothetical protein
VGPLPRTTEAIAAWLQEVDRREEIAGIRAWHGEAALVRALEEVAPLPAAARGPAFFRCVNAMKRARVEAGHWPETDFATWTAPPAAPTAETVALTWWRLGAVRLDEDGALTFPTAPSGPGLYRLTIGDSAYLGASEAVARSLQHLRTPGASEQTHLRLRDAAVDELRRGGAVEVRVCVTASAGGAALDLGDDEDRALARRVALAALADAGVALLNRRR